MKYQLLILCLSLYTYSQAQVLFDAGSSGFDLGAQFTSTQASTLVGLLPSYTANGKVSFGVGIGFESHKDVDLNSTAVRPYLSYLVLRQGENDMPISVAVGGAYQYNTFSDLDLTANTIAFGMGIAHQIKASGNLDIFPGGSVGWDRTTFSLSGFMEDFTDITYGLGATLLFSKRFYISPGLSFSDGDSVFSLGIGILFPS